MSSHLKSFFVIALILAVFAVPVLADSSQGNSASVDGKGNVLIQRNTVHTDIGTQYVREDINAPTYVSINYEAPVDMVPDVVMLGIGDAESTRMIQPNEVLSFPAEDRTYHIRSSVPLAVYVIATGNDRINLDSLESKMEYNNVYHKFYHGTVSPVWIYPQYTTKCSFTTSGSGYIVFDNRYFPDYGMIEIVPEPITTKEST